MDLIAQRTALHMLSQVHLSLVSSSEISCCKGQRFLKFAGSSTLIHESSSCSIIGCGPAVVGTAELVIHHHQHIGAVVAMTQRRLQEINLTSES